MSKLNDPKKKMTTATPFAEFVGDMTVMQKEAAELMVAAMPRFTGMTNLSAQPMGAMAAASALGMGMAGQMFGLMAGTMAGAMRAANMLANDTAGGPSGPFGAANPLNFDWATGTFDDTKAEDPVTHQPPVTPDTPAKKKTARPKPAAAKTDQKTVKPKPAVSKSAVGEPAAGARIQPVAPEALVKPPSVAKPDTPDDLKAIKGIGPKLESVLNSLGIWTYAQIASWTPGEVAWVDDHLQFGGRIERDQWVAQAVALAGKA